MPTTTTVTIQAKQFGQRAPLLPEWRVALAVPASADGRTTLRDLIAAVVAAEVAAFNARHADRRLTTILTAGQIAAGTAQGKIVFDAAPGQAVAVETAVTAAWRAFEDRLVYVFVDDARIAALDEPVVLGAESRLLFLRLVALIGG